MLRTKPTGDGGYDHNSYKSSDAVNNINWSVLDGSSKEYITMLYYKGLIEMRKEFGVFTTTNAAVMVEELSDGAMAITIDNHQGAKALIVINPNNSALNYTLKGSWNLVADGTRAGSEILSVDSGEIVVDAISVHIYVNDNAYNN